MAYDEICSRSLRTIGACGAGLGIATTKSSSAVVDFFSSRYFTRSLSFSALSTASTELSSSHKFRRMDRNRESMLKGRNFGKSWSPPTDVDFRVWKSLQKGYQGRPQSLRHTSLRLRVNANPAQQDSFGCVGALTTTEDGLPEKPCAHQSAGPRSSTLEKWLESYLAEIVRHLPDAPFLQLVPKYDSLCGERQRVSEELFEKPENWQSVKHCLVESAPDGIILVHRLDQEELSECCLGDCNRTGESSSRTNTSLQAGGSSTDVWGVLVHGCKTQSNACYILKTTQVASSTGILTHFCISRAKCFGPSIKSQLQSTWLL